MLLTARLSDLSLNRGDMSSAVRAGVVTRILCCHDMSCRRSVVERWTRIPFGRRSPTTVTSQGRSHCLQYPHKAMAELWLSTAPGPQARTAALAHSCGV